MLEALVEVLNSSVAISVSAKTKDDAEEIEKKITEELNEFFM